MNRAAAAIAAIVGLFVLVQLAALALVAPFDAAGYQAVPDSQTSNPVNSLVYVAGILVATGVMLAAFKFGVDGLVRLFVVASATFISYYVFSVVLPVVVVAGVSAPAAVASLVVAGALLLYPEWYVIDAAGVVMGGGAAGLFGISFGVLPTIVLLSVLAVYDAISVYGTEHMLDLASGVMDLKIPVLLVVPLSLSYSFLDAAESDREAMSGDGGEPNEGEDAATEDDSEGLDRDAFFIGLGDAVMPTVLVASAAHFVEAPAVLLGANLPALAAAVGTLVGLVVLMRFVVRGRAHAGLPLLNGGAIAGYLLGALAVGIPLVEALGLAPYL
ncbi:presenilin family intramembrane aspartyl protease PSH [Halosegnis marinus]|uniref:Presenilin family intramembrane aspartyl protease PSH n=1 Tax=Halosegnis marinus TaxID=3034023 RepID=A0ABD5ZRL9_9EURY|nr:presenilin family intramembrane aspartyl protease PSH [Halosegnis sp. DT85]